MNDLQTSKVRPASAAPAPTKAQSKATTPPPRRSAAQPPTSAAASASDRPTAKASEQAKNALSATTPVTEPVLPPARPAATHAEDRSQPGPSVANPVIVDDGQPVTPGARESADETTARPGVGDEAESAPSERLAGGSARAESTVPLPEDGSSRSLPIGRIAAAVVLAAVILVGGLGVFWTIQPAARDVLAETQAAAGGDGAAIPPGAATVVASIAIADTLLEKPGGYLRNDLTPPGILMDNMLAWEYGALTELRDTVRSLRNDFSRSQTQSIENEDLKQADSQFNFDSESWLLPSTEEEYQTGITALEGYLQGLLERNPRARFYTRADNLSAYLAVVEKRLGSLAQRLAASVGDSELTAALAGGPSVQGLPRTAWNEIDNVFYEARGYTWALLHTMQALAIDFAPVLENKNAQVSMQQVIRDLEGASTRKWSPLVLNGHGYGLLANHSLVMASYISRTNAAVLDLRVLLERG